MTRPDHTAVPPADVIAGAEPVAWMCKTGHGTGWRETAPADDIAWAWTPLYRHPASAAQAEDHACADCGSKRPLHDLDCPVAIKALAEGAAPTAAQAAWISVADRLPEIGTEVLVYRPGSERGKVTALARFIRHEAATDYWWDNAYPGKGNMHLDTSITHWMPLPSHAPHATLAASRDAESATSGATSAAKVELEEGDDPLPEKSDLELGRAYRQMVGARKKGLDVDFMSGWISLPRGQKPPKSE
jgi:hypothetical protein